MAVRERETSSRAIAGDGTEDVTGQAVRVDADQGRRWAFEAAADQSDVLVVVDVAGVGDHAEIAEARGKNGFGDAANVPLVLHAVPDQIGHREHFQFVLAAEFVELRDARHGAVFVHDFADDGGGVQPGDAGEIDAGFGLAGADEHAAIAGAQWKDVARAGEILRAGLRVDGGEDGDGAVGGADAGSDTQATIDGFGEGGAVDRGVDRGHERKVELVAAVFGERQADQAAGVLGHEVDSFGGDFFGGHG